MTEREREGETRQDPLRVAYWECLPEQPGAEMGGTCFEHEASPLRRPGAAGFRSSREPTGGFLKTETALAWGAAPSARARGARQPSLVYVLRAGRGAGQLIFGAAEDSWEESRS